MAKVRLGDIATVVTKGTTPTTMGFQFEDGGINFVKIESISEDGTFLKEKFSHISDECNVQMRRSQLQENDILFSIAGAIGRSAIVTKEILPANTNQALAIIRVSKGKIDYNYLLYALSSSAINQQATQHQQGVAQLNISLKNVSDFLLPIYTEAMQKRIVHNLKKIDKLISLHKQQLAKLDELVKARFVEMFGDPINNPMKWTVSKIEDITAQEKNALKAGPFGSALKKEFYVRSGYKIYGQEQVICGDASFGDYYIDEEKYKKLKNCAVQAGDILISLVGTYGKTLIMPDNYEAGIINPRLMKITLNKNKVTPIYFKYYFESNALKASMDANTHGGTMGILNLGIIRQMKIQVPPLSLQNQFAAFVERVDQQKQTVQQSLEKLELMKKALMQEYFG